MPDRADAAQRKLAAIWGGPAITATTADSVAPVEQQGHDAEPVNEAPHDPNGPQRMLAAIWKPKPEDSDEQRPPKPDQSREHVDELCARLSAELSERSRTLGPEDSQTTDVQLKLADAQLEAGRTADAIPLLERLIAAIDPADSSAGPKRASATGALAAAYLSTRQPQLAIGLYESLLAGEPGASTRTELLDYRIKLAVAHRAMGNVTATVDQLNALRIELEGDGSAQQQLLDAGVELATTNVVAGRPRDGVTLYENALSLSNAVHGANHRTTLGIRMMLARACQQAGQSAEAASVYEQLVGDAELALGADDRLTVQAGSELAVLLQVRA
ncbi:MAG TPA: tetratricopeptide repeat protein [Solirubrobacteraceae bacterium]|jgi:tetratricopeptide (TPR) repeat protein|nr:tetratricopeptide repeat protein [Solirubrobacteraceae bacterium]